MMLVKHFATDGRDSPEANSSGQLENGRCFVPNRGYEGDEENSGPFRTVRPQEITPPDTQHKEADDDHSGKH